MEQSLKKAIFRLVEASLFLAGAIIILVKIVSG
jgi:hypothetical protein